MNKNQVELMKKVLRIQVNRFETYELLSEVERSFPISKEAKNIIFSARQAQECLDRYSDCLSSLRAEMRSFFAVQALRESAGPEIATDYLASLNGWRPDPADSQCDQEETYQESSPCSLSPEKCPSVSPSTNQDSSTEGKAR